MQVLRDVILYINLYQISTIYHIPWLCHKTIPSDGLGQGMLNTLLNITFSYVVENLK